MPSLIDLTLTSPYFPSQWEAKTPDGGWVYIKYRSSRLSWGSGISLDRAVANSFTRYSRLNDQHQYDGEMSTFEMLHWLEYLWPEWKPLSVKFWGGSKLFTLPEMCDVAKFDIFEEMQDFIGEVNRLDHTDCKSHQK